MLWNTRDIISAISDVADVRVQYPLQVWETEQVLAWPKGGDEEDINLFITGFVSTGRLHSVNDVQVEAVAVQDGQDDEGGLVTDNETIKLLYDIICSRLKNLGFRVAPNTEG